MKASSDSEFCKADSKDLYVSAEEEEDSDHDEEINLKICKWFGTKNLLFLLTTWKNLFVFGHDSKICYRLMSGSLCSYKYAYFKKIMDPRLNMYLRKYKPNYFSAVLDFDFVTSKSGLWSSLDRLTLVGGANWVIWMVSA